MAVQCGACTKFVSSQGGGTCVTFSKCKKKYHKVCVGLLKTQGTTTKWGCPECVASTPRGNNQDGKPLREEGVVLQSQSPSLSDSGSAGPLDTPVLTEASELVQELRSFKSEIREAMNEIRALRDEMRELRGLVAACEQRQDKLEARLERLEQNTGEDEDTKNAIKTLESTVSQLKSDLCDREQELLCNDLQISGIPEENGENTIHLMLTCAAKLGVAMQEQDIASCYRVGAVPNAESGVAAERKRIVVVRLTRRDTRDALLQAARVRRGATTEGFGLQSAPQKFYLNERLTSTNRSLFGLAHQIRKDLNYAPEVWTRQGKVYARQGKGLKIHRIRSEDDIERVFGPDSFRRARDAHQSRAGDARQSGSKL